MVRLSTPHAHTRYVDGKNTPLEMLEAAIAKEFVSFGFSEHGRQTFDYEYALNERTERDYIRDVEELKVRFAGQIEVFLGIERDEYGASDRALYQYVIGSKHYFFIDGNVCAADGPFDEVEACCVQHFGGDWFRMTARYFADLAQYIEDYRPEIIGHFDVIAKHNEGGRLFDEGDKRYLDAGYCALERMRASDALLEINTGAIARGYRTTPYPALAFLKFWRERGGRAIVSSDCHDAQKLGAGYDAAYALLDAAGYREAWALGGGDLFTAYKL